MHGLIDKLNEQNAEQAKQIAALLEQLQVLLAQNKLLQRKVDFLVHRLFGRRTEKLNAAQLELLLGNLVVEPEDEPPRPPTPPRPRGPRDRKPRMPADLPTEEIVIDPEVVEQDPKAYQCIGQEVTEELDVVPTRYFRRRIIRRKFKSKVNRDLPPVIAPLPPRIIEGGYASPGLLTDIILKKYADHLPLHRQEQILRTRHGIELSRKTMCDWVGVVADWLKPIYNHIRDDLRGGGYLQVDETPVLYCREEGSGSRQGYLWVFNRPRKEVLFEWHTSRAASCLDGMLKSFHGTVQCDGYTAYSSYARGQDGIQLAGCWAHVRRKFYEAREECRVQAGWLLNQIGLLYCIERNLKGTGPRLRHAFRSSESAMLLGRIEKMLKLKMSQHRPTSAMGSAIAYALSLWPQLLRFRDDGRLEIDNNLVENAIRPTAVGKKNWLFIGHPEAGERSAIIYTLLENCKRLSINPRDYLHDVLTRLPAMTNWQTSALTPANWLASRTKSNSRAA